MTIYLMENSKPTEEVADVNVPELEKVIHNEKRKLSELEKIKRCATSTASMDSWTYDKKYLKELGVPFKPLRLIRKVGF